MAEYKCIGCGKVIDSEAGCGCPDCGFKMFPAPYDRREQLLCEIRGFLAKLRIDGIRKGDLAAYREEQKGQSTHRITKKKDDERFPPFDTIRTYVTEANKTEAFLERLNDSLQEIGKHLHETVNIGYAIDPRPLLKRIADLDEVTLKAARILGLPEALPPVCLPQLTLDHRVSCNEALMPIADETLALLGKLLAKLERFIRANNLYGTFFKRTGAIEEPQPGDQSPDELLTQINDELAQLLNERFVIDLLADGSDEVFTMTHAMWRAVRRLMSLPIRAEDDRWHFGSTEGDGNAVSERILEAVDARYADIDRHTADAAFLAGKDEEELLELYTGLIEIDRFGFIGVSADALSVPGESERRLSRMIGLTGIKESIRKIKAYAMSNRDSEALNIHMCFYGNPGTGKTEVARCIAGILHENRILPTDKVVEVDRSGLVGEYVGETPMKTMAKVKEAMGGVLFIDEAYALVSGSWDYGKEAVATLIKAMEDHRGKFCVILAGYRNQMLEMLKTNPGFQSRIQFELDFPNYSREELRQIGILMAEQRGYTFDGKALDRLLDVTDILRKNPDFANAREMRNLLDQIIMCQNLRTLGSGSRELAITDVNKYITDAKISLPTADDGPQKKLLSGEEELDRLIGLTAVKRMVKKIRAYAKRNAHDEHFNLHMCFYGNPGTGKTEVARILSRILYDAGVLPESKVIETDANGLLGQYVGETGPKTEKKIREAMGGVLFIDEAYSLDSNTAAGYGDEAIAVLLKQMEDHRGRFCVILAGYKDEMTAMLSRNPGFQSRIPFTLDFPDYSRDELGEIAVQFLSAKKYTITDDALNRLLDVVEYDRQRPNFANARTVRNILDQVIMNQNLRAEDSEDDFEIIADDVNDYIADEGIDLQQPGSSRRIGF